MRTPLTPTTMLALVAALAAAAGCGASAQGSPGSPDQGAPASPDVPGGQTAEVASSPTADGVDHGDVGPPDTLEVPASPDAGADKDAAHDVDGDGAVEDPPDVAPPVCLEPLPPVAPTAAADTCDKPTSEPLLVTADADLLHLDLAAQTASSYLVAAAAPGEVRAWRVTGNQVVDTHQWPAPALDAGPWAAAEEGGGYLIVWGDGGDVRFARPGEDAVNVGGGGTPLGVLAAPMGARILVRGDDIVDVVTTDSAGAEEARHYVNASAKIGQVWFLQEGGFILMPYSTPDEPQSLWYQTSSLAGGQCSLPAPYGYGPGAEAEIHTVGLAYGIAVFAWTLDPGAGCPAQHRIQVRTGIAEVLHVDSAWPLDAGAAVLADELVATVFTVVPDEAAGGFFAAAQFLDMPAAAPGASAAGLSVTGGGVPALWAVDRDRGKYVLGWAGADGVTVQSFCF